MKKIIPCALLAFVLVAGTHSAKIPAPPALLVADSDMVLVEGFGPEGSAYDFRIGRYEVTQELYKAVMGTNPSYFSKNPPAGENQRRRPVEFVTWYDAVSFCNKLTILTMGEEECCYTLTNMEYETDDDELAKKKAFKEDPTYVTYNKRADVTIRHDRKGFRLPTREERLFAAKGGLKSGGYFYSTAGGALLTAYDEGLESPGNGGRGYRIVCAATR